MPWNKVTVKRSELRRVGATFGKGFATVRGVRWMMQATEGGANSEVRFEDTSIAGGVNRPIFGAVEYCYVLVRDDGTYLAKSAPSAASASYTLDSNGATVRVPADGSRDTQVNAIWLFRRGGGLPDWYRVAVHTAGLPSTGVVDITDTLSAADALIVGILLEDDNSTPPDNIIGIAGPYYDRTFYLTVTHLYPSRRRNPDSCSTGQAIQVAGADEEALWVTKTIGGLFIGTTKDVYRLAGDGAEYPDGTINFTLTPLNIDNPPRSSAVAQEGNNLVYLAADGWRALAGAGSVLMTGGTSQLYIGKTRHGISPVNIDAGRFRAAIAHGELSAITPEGNSTTSSSVLYRLVVKGGRWYRHPYTPSWRSIYREPDGTLIAGDSSGFVWVLDSGNSDNGARIPVEMWTRHDDVGHPFRRKDPHDFRVMVMTGGRDASIEIYANNQAIVSQVLSANTTRLTEALFSLTEMQAFRLAQFRVSGDFNEFRWAGSNLGFHPLPMLMRGHTPSFNFDKPGLKTISGIQLRICTLNVTRTITPVLDGVEYATFTVRSAADEPINRTYSFPFAVTAVEIQLLLDGDVEIYDWHPLVTAIRPLGIRAYDSGPMNLGTGEFIWPREVWLNVIATEDLVIQPYFDGVDYGTVTATIGPLERGTASKIRVPLPRGYKGRVPRFIIHSDAVFFPYWFQFVRRETGAKIEKDPITVNCDLGGHTPA